MKRLARVALALASAAIVVPSVAAAQAKPVVAVLYFENNSIGKDARDYDGVGKGMAEFMIHELAMNPNVRVIERERIEALMTEQNMTKTGAIDPQTAIKLGKFVGAQYMIWGTFMSDGRGNYVLTGRSTNVETSEIANPTRINAKGDDVLGMIAQLTSKMSTEMKLPALRTADASVPSAMPAGAPAAAAAAEKTATTTTADASKPASAQASKAAPADKPAPAAKPTRKMDMKTAMLYSKALEAEDAGNRAQAIELYTKVNVAFPGYAPVQAKLKKLS
jgi:TolB-like protein